MRKKLAFSLLIILFVAGCSYSASFVKTTDTLLGGSKAAYDTAGAIVKDYHKQGRIDDEKKAEILEVARPYAIAHNELAETLATYAETKDASDIDKIEALALRVSEALVSIFKEINKILQRGN